MIMPTYELYESGKLTSLLGRTLEEAAFVFAQYAPAPAPYEGEVVLASLAFWGPEGEPGELRLWASPAMTASLAANLLGLEAGAPEASERGGDALGELCNIAGGILLVELFGPSAICRLDVPRLLATSPEVAAAGAGCSCALVTDEGERIDVGLTCAGASLTCL